MYLPVAHCIPIVSYSLERGPDRDVHFLIRQCFYIKILRGTILLSRESKKIQMFAGLYGGGIRSRLPTLERLRRGLRIGDVRGLSGRDAVTSHPRVMRIDMYMVTKYR